MYRSRMHACICPQTRNYTDCVSMLSSNVSKIHAPLINRLSNLPHLSPLESQSDPPSHLPSHLKHNTPLQTSNLLLMPLGISISNNNILPRRHRTRNLHLLHNLPIPLLNRTFQINSPNYITELVFLLDQGDVTEFYLDEEFCSLGDGFTGCSSGFDGEVFATLR